MAGKYKNSIAKDLKLQTAVVRGKDKQNRALVLIFPRTSAETTDDEFVLTQLYTMERAIACTEIASEGREEKVLAVLDFSSFQSKYAPSLQAVKSLVSILQTKYPERLKNLVVIDPPFWMRSVYALIKPFLDPETRAKFILASGSKKKVQIISEFVDDEHAMPFMIPTGKLTSEIDLDHFLTRVPFHSLYDDAPVAVSAS